MHRDKFVLIAIVALFSLGVVPHAFPGSLGPDDDEMGMSTDPTSAPDNDEHMNGQQPTMFSAGQADPTAQPLTLNGPGSNDGEDDGTPGQDSPSSDGDEGT